MNNSLGVFQRPVEYKVKVNYDVFKYTKGDYFSKNTYAYIYDSVGIGGNIEITCDGIIISGSASYMHFIRVVTHEISHTNVIYFTVKPFESHWTIEYDVGADSVINKVVVEEEKTITCAFSCYSNCPWPEIDSYDSYSCSGHASPDYADILEGEQQALRYFTSKYKHLKIENYIRTIEPI